MESGKLQPLRGKVQEVKTHQRVYEALGSTPAVFCMALENLLLRTHGVLA
jgi:hypothetical protein